MCVCLCVCVCVCVCVPERYDSTSPAASLASCLSCLLPLLLRSEPHYIKIHILSALLRDERSISQEADEERCRLNFFYVAFFCGASPVFFLSGGFLQFAWGSFFLFHHSSSVFEPCLTEVPRNGV